MARKIETKPEATIPPKTLASVRKTLTDLRTAASVKAAEAAELEQELRRARRSRSSKISELEKAFETARVAAEAAEEAYEETGLELIGQPETRTAALFVTEEIGKADWFAEALSSKPKRRFHGTNKIQYMLRPFKVLDAGESGMVYRPQVVRAHHFSPERFAEQVSRRVRTVTPETAAMVIDAMEEVLLDNLGMNASTTIGKLFLVAPSLKGVCTSADLERTDKPFQPSVTVKALGPFQELFRSQAGLERVRTDRTRSAPLISDVEDFEFGATSRITAGGVVWLKGRALKLNPDYDTDQVELFNPSTGYSKVLAVPDRGNMPSKLMVQLPKIVPLGGDYRFAVTKRLPNSVRTVRAETQTTFTCVPSPE